MHAGRQAGKAKKNIMLLHKLYAVSISSALVLTWSARVGAGRWCGALPATTSKSSFRRRGSSRTGGAAEV